MIASEVKRGEVGELCDRLGYLGDLIVIEVKIVKVVSCAIASGISVI